jgi:hypothetical protein
VTTRVEKSRASMYAPREIPRLIVRGNASGRSSAAASGQLIARPGISIVTASESRQHADGT